MNMLKQPLKPAMASALALGLGGPALAQNPCGDVTEDASGKASVSWREPSAVFAPYGSADLNAMARELDPVFDKIVRDAIGG